MECHDSCDFMKFSCYLHEIISKTRHFRMFAQENHEKLLKLQRKLDVYEKFQGLDTLSAMNLQKLEKHLKKGVDLVKDERIRRKYEEKLADLQEKLGIPKENHDKTTEKIRKSVDSFNELCEDLRISLEKFPDFTKELDVLRQWPAPNYEKIVKTVKKTRHFSFGQMHFQEIIEQNLENYHNSFANPKHFEENLVAKVASFDENNSNLNINNNDQNFNVYFTNKNRNLNKSIDKITEGELFLIREILSSKHFNGEIAAMGKISQDFIAETRRNEELSPEFQVKSTKTKEKVFENMYNSFIDGETSQENHGKKASLSDIPLAESVEILFNNTKKAEENEENEKKLEILAKNMESTKEISNKENNYLKKLRRKMLK